MLGYVSLGAAYAKVSGRGGRDLIIKALILAVVTICVLQLGLLAVTSWFYPLPKYLLSVPLQGYANNENAFCFELANAVLLLIVARLLGVFNRQLILCYLAMTIIALTVYFTSSRTGAIFIVLMLCFDAALWWAPLRNSFSLG